MRARELCFGTLDLIQMDKGPTQKGQFPDFDDNMKMLKGPMISYGNFGQKVFSKNEDNFSMIHEENKYR